LSRSRCNSLLVAGLQAVAVLLTLVPCIGSQANSTADPTAELTALFARLDRDDGTPYVISEVSATIRSLLAQGAEVNVRGPVYGTALTRAAMYGDAALAQDALDRGADVNVRDSVGYTPLIWAAFTGRRSLVQLLLAHHADVNVRSERGYTALHMVCGGDLSREFPVTEIVRALLAAGASVDIKDISYRTPLFTYSDGPPAAIKLLLDHGARVSVWDVENHTPLFRAREDLASLRLSVRHNTGVTSWDVERQQEVVRLLEAARTRELRAMFRKRPHPSRRTRR
jgi:ankyrin repeat protein